MNARTKIVSFHCSNWEFYYYFWNEILLIWVILKIVLLRSSSFLVNVVYLIIGCILWLWSVGKIARYNVCQALTVNLWLCILSGHSHRCKESCGYSCHVGVWKNDVYGWKTKSSKLIYYNKMHRILLITDDNCLWELTDLVKGRWRNILNLVLIVIKNYFSFNFNFQF